MINIVAYLALTILPIGQEHSGIAFDQHKNLWSHPDSGNPSELYRFSPDYRTSIKLYPPPVNHDFEDLSIGPCRSIVAKECVYLADIGSKGGRYKHSPFIYEMNINNLHDYKKYTLPYSDYYADAEAFSIRRGLFYLMRKDGTKKLLMESRGKFRYCVDLGSSQVHYVTGMDYKGNKLAITYHTKGNKHTYHVIEYLIDGCKLFSRKYHDFSTKKQVEAIAYHPHGYLVVVAETGEVWVLDSNL